MGSENELIHQARRLHDGKVFAESNATYVCQRVARVVRVAVAPHIQNVVVRNSRGEETCLHCSDWLVDKHFVKQGV
jgi:hypothetical protein